MLIKCLNDIDSNFHASKFVRDSFLPLLSGFTECYANDDKKPLFLLFNQYGAEPTEGVKDDDNQPTISGPRIEDEGERSNEKHSPDYL